MSVALWDVVATVSRLIFRAHSKYLISLQNLLLVLRATLIRDAIDLSFNDGKNINVYTIQYKTRSYFLDYLLDFACALKYL